MMAQKIIKLISYFLLIILLISGISEESLGQKYIARKGFVRFFSEAPLEDIEAINGQGLSIFETSTGHIAFTIPIDQFEFEKKLMQQHFNENYLESEKYPNSTFKGEIIGFSDAEAVGKQDLKAKGEITIHGITREITVTGTGVKRDNHIVLESTFPVALKDHNIKIPRVVLYNIAEIVEVTIKFEYVPYEEN